MWNNFDLAVRCIMGIERIGSGTPTRSGTVGLPDLIVKLCSFRNINHFSQKRTFKWNRLFFLIILYSFIHFSEIPNLPYIFRVRIIISNEFISKNSINVGHQMLLALSQTSSFFHHFLPSFLPFIILLFILYIFQGL